MDDTDHCHYCGHHATNHATTGQRNPAAGAGRHILLCVRCGKQRNVADNE